MELFNKVLIGKWRWRFINEANTLWARVITSISKGSRGASARGRGNSLASGWWNDVLKVTSGLESCWFWDDVNRRVGDGRKRHFGVICGLAISR